MKSQISILHSRGLKKVLLTAITLCTFFGIQAQQVSFDLAPSFTAGIKYPNTQVETTLNSQLSIGLSYLHKIKSGWAVVTGIHLGRLNSTIDVKNNTFTNNKIDDRNSAFELRVTPNNFKETQKQTYFKIPLLAQYSKKIGKNTHAYGALGVSYYLFADQTSQVTAKSIQVFGYYPDVNIEIKNAANHGFGTLNNISKKIQTDYKDFATLSAEAGLKWNIKTDFYLGIFFDYGLTSLQKQQGNIVNHNSTNLDSNKIKGVSYLTNIGKPQFYNVGIKLRMGLSPLTPKGGKAP